MNWRVVVLCGHNFAKYSEEVAGLLLFSSQFWGDLRRNTSLSAFSILIWLPWFELNNGSKEMQWNEKNHSLCPLKEASAVKSPFSTSAYSGSRFLAAIAMCIMFGLFLTARSDSAGFYFP